MENNTTYIYALKDPGTGRIRYVGKSNDPEHRLANHYSGPIGSKNIRWIRGLRKRGLRPELIILEKCSRDNYRQAENSWIHFFLDLGCDLTNSIYKGYDRVEMLREAYTYGR